MFFRIPQQRITVLKHCMHIYECLEVGLTGSQNKVISTFEFYREILKRIKTRTKKFDVVTN